MELESVSKSWLLNRRNDVSGGEMLSEVSINALKRTLLQLPIGTEDFGGFRGFHEALLSIGGELEHR